MKITFLGTSHGIPSSTRYCTCTMLEVGGSVYFIDMGAPAIDLLLRMDKDPKDVKAVFTTHIHGDHTDGILEFADLCNWAYPESRPIIYMTEQRGVEMFPEMIRLVEGGDTFFDDRIRFRLMTAETVYEDENIRVTPIPTRHIAYRSLPSYAYLVEAEGKKLLFSGDLSGKLAEKDFPAYVLENPVDLMVCEMAHFDIADVTPYLEKAKPAALLFNHVFPVEKLPHIQALNGKFGYPIDIVKDGDSVTL